MNAYLDELERRLMVDISIKLVMINPTSAAVNMTQPTTASPASTPSNDDCGADGGADDSIVMKLMRLSSYYR